MQNLVSRIAGVNNEELANRGIGMGAAMGYTVRSIAYQFKGNESENQGKTDIISRVINKANNTESTPVNNVSYESYSKNAMEEPNSKSITSGVNTTGNKTTNTINNVQNTNKDGSTINGIRKAYNVGKEFMNMGMYMAEGRNFRTNTQEQNQRRIYNRPNINNTRKEETKEEESKTITVEVDDADE